MKTITFVWILFLAVNYLPQTVAEAQTTATGSTKTVSAASVQGETLKIGDLKDKLMIIGKPSEDSQRMFTELAKLKSSDAANDLSFHRVVSDFLAKRYIAQKTDPNMHLDLQAKADYYHTLCESIKSSAHCTEAKTMLGQFEKARKTAGADNTFTYKPQAVLLPEYDLAKSELKVGGAKFDFTGKVLAIAAVNNPLTVAGPPAASAVAGAAVATVAAATNNGGGIAKDVVVDAQPVNEVLNYTCEWKKDLQRKVLRGESCNESGKRICSGYVNCTKNNKEKTAFTRLATCAESLCGEDKASECSKQPKYGSRNPEAEDSAFTDAKASPKAGAAK